MEKRESHGRAVQLMVKLINDQLGEENEIQRKYQERLVMILTALLKFKSEEATEKWLLKQNKQCDNLAPLDLVNSEYGARHLMKVIASIKQGEPFS